MKIEATMEEKTEWRRKFDEEIEGSQPAEWRTSEMVLVAYLVCLGHETLRMEIDDGSCYWVFARTEEMREEVDRYLEGDALVDPRKFNNNVARLKREMFEFGRDNGVNFGRRVG